MRERTQKLVLAALFAALSAIGAFVKIPVGPVPITLQFFFIALSGILLGPYLGALSQLIYAVLGLIGVPVFTSGGGLSYIFTPTFGYIIGFILAPFVIGKISGISKQPSFLNLFAACICGILVIYAAGVPYMFLILRCLTHVNITFAKAIVTGFLIFLPGDIIKSLLAAYLGKRILPAVTAIPGKNTRS